VLAAVGLALGAGGASLFWPLVMSTVSKQASQVVSAVGTFTAAGYIGWVRINFRQKGAPSLPTEDGHILLKLNAKGILQTSSDPQQGHGKDEFFYYGGDRRTLLSNAGVCKGGMIWQVETMVDESTSTPFSRFFIGTEDQYRHEVDPDGKEPACE